MSAFLPITTERLVLRRSSRATRRRSAPTVPTPTSPTLQSWETPFTIEMAERFIAECPTRRSGQRRVGPDRRDPRRRAGRRRRRRARSPTAASPRSATRWPPRTRARGWRGKPSAPSSTGCSTSSACTASRPTSIPATSPPPGSSRISGSTTRAPPSQPSGHGASGSTRITTRSPRTSRRAWRRAAARPPGRRAARRGHPGQRRKLYRLRTHRNQQRFVATMPESFADALVPEIVDGAPVVPWMRGGRGRRRAGRLRDAGRGHRRPPRAVPLAPVRRPPPPATGHRRPHPRPRRRAAARRRPPHVADELGVRSGRTRAVLRRPRLRPDGPHHRRRDRSPADAAERLLRPQRLQW